MALGDPIKSMQEIINRVWDPINDVLRTNAAISGDIALGAVEIKNATTDDRATVNTGGQLFVKASDLEAILTAIKDTDGIKQIQDPVEIRLYDAAGNALTSTTVGPKQAADVFIAGGESDVNLRDGSGNLISSTGGALDVNLASGSISVGLAGDEADLDSGAGTDSHEVFAIGLPGPGGHVVGGTATDPFRIDPTGTTTQPISAASLPLPTGAATESTLATINSKLVSGTDIGDVTINNAAGVAAVNIQDGGNSITVDGTVDSNMRDGAGNPITSTGGALDVNIAAGSVTLNVNLDNADDDVLVYGWDGSSNQKIKTDAGGELQIDVLNFPSVQSVDDNGGSLTVDGTVDVGNFPTVFDVNLQDGAGNDIGSTAGALDVNIASGTLSVSLPGDQADLDSGAGTDSHAVIAIGLPGSGGHVVGGTATDPIRIDPTGATVQPVSDNGGSLTVDGVVDSNMRDGGGTALTSTLTGGKQALDVNIAGGAGVTLEVNLDNANDDVLIYGYDGATNRAIKTDASGELQVDVLNFPAVQPVSDNGGSLTVDGAVDANLQDGAGNDISSTGGSLHVNITNATVPVTLDGDKADLDSGAGTDNHSVVAIGLPGSGGHVVGGTATNPLRTDPTGTTTQPISAASLPLPTGAATEATLSTINGKLVNGNDIGDVTINNASGGSAVNIQDGGNVISVDDAGGSLTIDGTVNVNLQDGAGTDITSTLVGSDQALDVNIVSSGGSSAIYTIEHANNLAQGTTYASFGFSGTARRFTIVNSGTKDGFLSLDGGTSDFSIPLGGSYEPPVDVALTDADIKVKSSTSTTDFRGIFYK